MAASGSSLRFQIEVAADQAEKTLKAMTVAFNEAGAQARIAMSGAATASKTAGAEVVDLFGKMKELRGEARQHERVFNYYGTKVAEVTGLTKGLGAEITGLGIALASGMWVAAAVEGARLIAGELERQHEWTRRLGELTATVSADIAAGWERVRVKIEGLTLAQKAWNEEFKAHADAVKAAKDELKKYEDGFKGIAYWWNLGDQWAEGLRARVAELNRELAAQRNQADIMAALAQEQGRAAQGPAADKAIVRIQREAAEAAEKRWRLEHQFVEEADAHIKAYYRHLEEAEKKATALVLKQSEHLTGFEEEGARNPEYLRLKAQDFAEEQRRYNQEVQRSAALATQWGEAVGSAIGALVTGQASAGQVIASIGQMIIKSVVQSAIASITADASRAAAGAAASQAGTPVIGPVLAISAMGAMLSAVLALLGKIGRAHV